MTVYLSKTRYWLLLSPVLLLCGAGCSDSDGFVEYSSVPSPESATTSGDTTAEPTAVAELAQPSTEEPPGSETTSENTPPPDATVQVAEEKTSDSTSSDSRPSPDDKIEAAVMPTGVHEVKLLIAEKHFRTEGDSGAIRLSYDDIDLMKVLNMHPVRLNAVDYFPDWLKALDGKRVRILGFMYPAFKATGLERFTLTRDTGACCFGPDPLLYFLIEVTLTEGQTTNYIESRRLDVEGIFRIDPEGDDDELFRLYRIENATILPR